MRLPEVKVRDLMSSSVAWVSPDTLVTEVAAFFDQNPFHHLPVLDASLCPVGVISRHDYYQIQHHFTRFGWQDPKDENQYLFGTLLAHELMTKDPVTLPLTATCQDALDIFLENKVHSIIIIEDEKCVGILTPLDILKRLSSNQTVVGQNHGKQSRD